MSLEKHFGSYRASLRRDSLEECELYSRNMKTQTPEKYPTIFSYLSMLMENLKIAVAKEHEPQYWTYIVTHQRAMITLFERMAFEAVWDNEKPDPDVLMALAAEYGWKWYKFCRASIKISCTISGEPTEIFVIPRYSCAFEDVWSKHAIVFDADEMALLESENGKKFGKEILNYKREKSQRRHKIMSIPIAGVPITDINNSVEVRDWSLSLRCMV
jgi:hypothetical protein